jgi:hypothetical protein
VHPAFLHLLTNDDNTVKPYQRKASAANPPLVLEADPKEEATVNQWFDQSVRRWRSLFPPDTSAPPIPAQFPLGHYAAGFRIFDLDSTPSMADLLEHLQKGIVRHTGWPPFWVPTNKQEIRPRNVGGTIECWIGADQTPLRDPAHADYWRVTPQGEFFLIRGYQEDSREIPERRNPQKMVEPGTSFDLTLPIWRLGEIMLYAASMARQLGNPAARIVFLFDYTGLRGRSLQSLANPNRMLHSGNISTQDEYRATLEVAADRIGASLVELVSRVVFPLYELFNFVKPTPVIVPEELSRMMDRGRR